MPVVKKCPVCGLYNDITKDICACEVDIAVVIPEYVESVTIDKYGNIDEDVPVYVQKCPFCQTENYTDSVNHPVKKCRHCQKLRIGQVVPVLMEPVSNEAGFQTTDFSNKDAVKEAPNSDSQSHKPVIESDIPDEVVALRSEWAEVVSKIFGETITGEYKEHSVPQKKESSTVVPNVPQTLRLTAVGKRIGLVEVFEPKDAPVLLGRYAADLLDRGDKRMAQYTRCENFLQQDTRVSGYHCHLVLKNNSWYVCDGSWSVPAKDIPEKPSKCSTRVNEVVVTKAHILNHGDILKLGNQPDSIQFKVEMVSCE